MQDAQNGIQQGRRELGDSKQYLRGTLQGGGRLRTKPGVIFSIPAYVPISQDARYFICSFVSVSIFIPMPASLSRAISLSITGGTG